MAEHTNTLEKQDGFQSQWGFIMAAVGSCVGMANVWRFPMLVSRYGGLTFLIPYFIFAFIISQSGMMEEFALGRWSGYGPVGSFGRAMENGGKSKRLGEMIGGVPVFASLCLGTGYAVIMGWVFYYTKMAFTGELVAMGQDMSVIGGTFGAVAPEAATLPEAIKMTFEVGGANNFWIIVAVAVSFAIMIMGIGGGIEASCKVMIPALYVLFIFLAVFMMFIPGAGDGYKYIFSLNPQGLLNPEVWVYAFGQCFFSLSVAGSGSVIYGSYLGKDVKIRQSLFCAPYLIPPQPCWPCSSLSPQWRLWGRILATAAPACCLFTSCRYSTAWAALQGSLGSSSMSQSCSRAFRPLSTCLKRRWPSCRKSCT